MSPGLLVVVVVQVYNIVSDVLSDLPQWEELPSDLGLKTTWNLLWTWSKPRIHYDSLLFFQRVNHFPNARELTRKDLLKRHLARYVALSGGSGSSSLLLQDPLGMSAPPRVPAGSSSSGRDGPVSE